jgi:hypothetical protein
MLELAKKSHWLQTLVVRLIAAMPPAIEHNLGKTQAIKKAFYFAFLENVPGDYLEFGVFEGTSLLAAFESDRRFRGPDTPPRKFWGFDSFAGFKYFNAADRHPFFTEGEFTSSLPQTQQRLEKQIRGRAEFELVPGYFEQTIAGKTAPELGIQQVSVALIDCDLGTPARLALDFMRPALQNGSIIILDDYFAYRGSQQSGVAGAFAQFQADHPALKFWRMFDYGHGGQGFVLAAGGQEQG